VPFEIHPPVHDPPACTDPASHTVSVSIPDLWTVSGLGRRPPCPVRRRVRRSGAVYRHQPRHRVGRAIGCFPGGRVLSRSRPPMPYSAKRCCHRHTIGRLRPRCIATRCTGSPDDDGRTTRARCACFCARLRSAIITTNHSLSDALTITQTVCAIREEAHGGRIL
jgi:hypothetical protein